MWETVIGLEVHVELATKSKIFCSCSTAFGGEPNTHCCPVCMGMPGTLPVFNGKVLEYAAKAALALNCQISRRTVFDRKNYFYPDLPKAYQISQLYSPIGRNGFILIEVDGQIKKIRIHEMHMEEDAGKLIHSEYENETYPDYNRCGVPLIEIVSEPDFRSAKEVIAYLEKLKAICEYLGISDCKMQEGSMRVDVNLSVRRFGEETLGVRTETKNINSFKAIERAIEYETGRQIDILESGGVVKQETRHWNDDKRYGVAMRSKENAQDYRYFPDPDLLPIEISEEMIAALKADLPELADSRKNRFMQEYGVSEYVSSRLTANKRIADLFEDTVRICGEAKEVANWLIEIMPKVLADLQLSVDDVTISPQTFASFVEAIQRKVFNKNIGIKVLTAMIQQGNSFELESFIQKNSMSMIDDTDEIRRVVKSVLLSNQKSVAEYRAGKTKVLGFLIGQVMRALGGKANPATVNEVILEELAE